MATEDTVSMPSGKKEGTPEHNGTLKKGKSLARFFKVWATPLSILASILIAAVTLLVSVQQFNGQQLDNAHMQATQEAVSAMQLLDQQHQTTLDTYLDRMSDLLLTDGLGTASPVHNALVIAEARTYAAVRNLDGKRKGILVRFLLTAGLISGSQPTIIMSNADLSGADFTNAELSGANLSGADLSGANFTNADLRADNLSEANLSGANFTNADLNAVIAISPSPTPSSSPVPSKICVSLKGLCVPRVIGKTDLSKADLIGTDLSKATNLNAATLRGAEYNTITAQEGTLNFGPTQWPQGFDLKTAGVICVDC